MSKKDTPFLEDGEPSVKGVIKDVLKDTADLLTVDPGTLKSLKDGEVPDQQADKFLQDRIHPIRVANDDNTDTYDSVMNTINTIVDGDGHAPDGIDIAQSIDDNLLHGASNAVANVNNWMTKQAGGSPTIVARARNSILQFPMYCTATLPVNQAHILGKLFERVYTSFVQTAITQHQIISEDEANDLVFLKKFHTNLREAAQIAINEYYKPIDRMDQILQESVFYTCEMGPGITMELRWTKDCPDDIIQESARLAGDPLTGFRYLQEAPTPVPTETVVRQDSKRVTLSEDDLRGMAANRIGMSSADLRLAGMSNSDIKRDVEAGWSNPDDQDGLQEEIQNKIYDRDNLRDQVDQATEELKADLQIMGKRDNGLRLTEEEREKYRELVKAGMSNIGYANGRYYRVAMDGSVTTQPSRNIPMRAQELPYRSSPATVLSDKDVRKLNGMQPYAMEIALRVRPKEGNVYEVRYVIGIKTVLHLIYAKDLCDDIRDLVTGKMRKLQKVRYKTGEISWMDYMFNLSGIKSDAQKRMDPHRRWLENLKKLAEFRQLHGSLWAGAAKDFAGKDMPIPNGTLILDHLDVDYITQNSGIDLNSIGYARRLCNSLFLIAIAIVDSTAGTMKVFFPDQDTDWDIQSLDAIQSELVKMDNNPLMKELQKRVMASY